MLAVNGADLVADPSGVLYWPAQNLLAVADLHFEKGTGLAAAGAGLIPPYDTRATLQRLAEAIRRLAPTRVICLGDSFHDTAAERRLGATETAMIRALTQGREWIWITGNHDPAPPETWGGRSLTETTISCLVFRHEAAAGGTGEVSGHFHPKASVRVRNRRLTTRCFATDGRRLILPAFGAFTGGLNVLDPAIAGLFPRGFQVRMLGREKIFAFTSKELVGPPASAVFDLRRQASL